MHDDPFAPEHVTNYLACCAAQAMTAVLARTDRVSGGSGTGSSSSRDAMGSGRSSGMCSPAHVALSNGLATLHDLALLALIQGWCLHLVCNDACHQVEAGLHISCGSHQDARISRVNIDLALPTAPDAFMLAAARALIAVLARLSDPDINCKHPCVFVLPSPHLVCRSNSTPRLCEFSPHSAPQSAAAASCCGPGLPFPAHSPPATSVINIISISRAGAPGVYASGSPATDQHAHAPGISSVPSSACLQCTLQPNASPHACSRHPKTCGGRITAV